MKNKLYLVNWENQFKSKFSILVEATWIVDAKDLFLEYTRETLENIRHIGFVSPEEAAKNFPTLAVIQKEIKVSTLESWLLLQKEAQGVR